MILVRRPRCGLVPALFPAMPLRRYFPFDGKSLPPILIRVG